MFPQFSWAREMTKHVTLHYPVFEVVPYNNYSNPRPFVQYGAEGYVGMIHLIWESGPPREN